MPPENPQHIKVAESPIVVGRSSAAGVRLFDPTVSLKHATIQRQASMLYVEDHDSQFGTFVNENRIRNKSAGIGDRIRFGTTAVYRVDSSGLVLDVSTPAGMRLSTTALAISRDHRTLVKGISFEFQPDSFVGILAPSGVGKTTLLNCLGGYLPYLGRLVFDRCHDVTQERETYLQWIGYVTQDDVVFPTLTVLENLKFAARLRLASVSNSRQIEEAVNLALERTSLSSKKHQIESKLSGGERKRLSVAIDLLKRPRLLLLDEPTSGLDPANETNLMEHLRQVAAQGTTTICTTHLTANLALFDEVLVLGKQENIGRVAYQGKPTELLAHFKCRDYADLYDRMDRGQFQPLEVPDHGVATKPLVGGQIVISAPAVQSDAIGARSINRGARGSPVPALACPRWLQLLLLCWRALRILLRNPGLVALYIFQPIGLGGLICLTQYRTSSTRSLLFFLVILAIWMGMNNSIRDLVRERKLYLRERLAGLDPTIYFISKAIFFSLLGAIQILLLLLVVFKGGNVLLAEDTYGDLLGTSSTWLFLVLLLSYLGALAMGLAVSAKVRTEAATVAALPLLLMPQLLLSAVATGEFENSYASARAFRPLYALIKDPRNAPATWNGKFVDFLSLLCISRPATLLAESPKLPNSQDFIWVADLAHLLLLLVLTWTLALVTFHRCEQRWLRLRSLE